MICRWRSEDGGVGRVCAEREADGVLRDGELGTRYIAIFLLCRDAHNVVAVSAQ